MKKEKEMVEEMESMRKEFILLKKRFVFAWILVVLSFVLSLMIILGYGARLMDMDRAVDLHWDRILRLESDETKMAEWIGGLMVFVAYAHNETVQEMMNGAVDMRDVVAVAYG
jgi:hypothetical protein